MLFQLGAFVTVDGFNKGLAKIVSFQEDGSGELVAEIEWFTSVSQHTSKPLLQRVPFFELRQASPPPQTRCYVKRPDGTWGVGRILGDEVMGDDDQVQLPVKIGGEASQWFDRQQVWVRCLLRGASPLQTLAFGAQDTPYFHARRHAFLRAYLHHRGAAAGLTGLLSARVQLLKHQVHVVRRVLEDPVCRYLLADEVGLGKTIEAGIIARQLRLDRPNLKILVVVPPALVTQWRRELEDKFALAVDGENLILLSTEDLAQTSLEEEKFGLVIFDEAHHIGSAHRDPARAELWEKCRALAHATPRLLLLSATPALGHEADFAAMLHLLEPQFYSLENLESFARRVADRQGIGRFLIGFNAPLARVVARRATPQLRALFSDDAAIMEVTNELQALIDASKETPWDADAADALTRRLRVQICEGYRLHRRLVRTSRSALLREGTLSQIEVGKRLGATVEWDYDARLEALHDALESWREAAYRRSGETAMNVAGAALRYATDLAEVYAVLWTCAATWHHLLRLAIECRLRVGDASDDDYADALGERERALLRAPLFEGEVPALQGILEALDADELASAEGEGPRDAIEVAVAAVAQEWRAKSKSSSDTTDAANAARAKVVVFTSSRLAAQTLARRLSRLERHNARVWTHLESATAPERDQSLADFEAHDGPSALICDRSGEEGLNLQFAGALLLFDLPPDPNRLEQRLGRLDRIGSACNLRPRVLAGWSGERAWGAPSPSIHDAWFRVLNEGLNVFRASVADLGYAIEVMLPRWKQLAFELGPQGLLDQIEAIQEEVKEERVKIREQAELDETEAFARDDDEFFRALVKADRDGRSLETGVAAWLCEGWKFTYDTNMEPPLVRLKADEGALVPRDWRERLLGAQNAVPASWPRPVGGCYDREVACERAHAQLLRPGAALLDELYALSLWDDRGQAFALWRPTSRWPHEEAGLFFRFDFLIEADLKPLKAALEHLKASGWRSSALSALARQAESWLPPQWKSYLYDRQGRRVTDPLIVELIEADYNKSGENRDYNLDAARSWALDSVIEPDKRKSLCERIGSHVVKGVRGNPKLQAQWSAQAARARHEGERRLELVRRGLLYNAAYNDGQTAADVEDQLAQESLLSEALCAGIAQPSIRIDAAGLYVLSRNHPPQEPLSVADWAPDVAAFILAGGDDDV